MFGQKIMFLLLLSPIMINIISNIFGWGHSHPFCTRVITNNCDNYRFRSSVLYAVLTYSQIRVKMDWVELSSDCEQFEIAILYFQDPHTQRTSTWLTTLERWFFWINCWFNWKHRFLGFWFSVRLPGCWIFWRITASGGGTTTAVWTVRRLMKKDRSVHSNAKFQQLHGILNESSTSK